MSMPQLSSLHPMLSSIVHLPFHTAAKQVGCGELSETEFAESLEQYLSKLPDTSFLDEIRGAKLWRAMKNGEVLAAEHINNEGILFHVQGKIPGNRYVDMRFYYHKDDWNIQAITSIHHPPFWRSRWRFVSEIVGGVVLLTLVVTGWSHHSVAYTKQGVESWAQGNGYKLVNAQSLQASPSTATSSSKGTATSNATSAASSAKTDASKHAATKTTVETYSFTFKSSMTVHDISTFLEDHHLVSNAYSFDNILQKDGVAKSVWPGTYTFKSNMSQSQVISVLKAGPSK